MSTFRTVTPGHKYELLNFEEPFQTQPQVLKFIKKVPIEGTDELKTVVNGTTNEAVIGMLIDRLKHLSVKLPDPHTKKAIIHLDKSLEELNTRTAKRKDANVEGTHKPIPAVEDLSDVTPDLEDIPVGPGPDPDPEPAAPTSTPIPDDLPHGTYLEKNGILTVEQLLIAQSNGPLTDLKWISEGRAKEIEGWIADNT